MKAGVILVIYMLEDHHTDSKIDKKKSPLTYLLTLGDDIVGFTYEKDHPGSVAGNRFKGMETGSREISK